MESGWFTLCGGFTNIGKILDWNLQGKTNLELNNRSIVMVETKLTYRFKNSLSKNFTEDNLTIIYMEVMVLNCFG